MKAQGGGADVFFTMKQAVGESLIVGRKARSVHFGLITQCQPVVSLRYQLTYSVLHRPRRPMVQKTTRKALHHSSLLPEPASTIVATAAFTGLRKSEVHGLLWENFRDDALWITQSVWEMFVDEPKTEESRAAIPVIAPLAQRLEKHRQAQGGPQTGFIFLPRLCRGQLSPANLNSVLKWKIKPKLKKEGAAWHGWHAFRCGLATKLNRLGVPDKTFH